MLHPFAGLKALYQNLGANQQIQLNTEVQSYAVDPEPFLNVEYPTDATNPTKQVNATYLEKVKNGTITTDHYSMER
jgi:predicted choloylglycine hydrolase